MALKLNDVEEYLDNRHLFISVPSPSSSIRSNDDSLSLQEETHETNVEVEGEATKLETGESKDQVKESLVKTLKVCLSQEEVDRIKKEYDRNMKMLSHPTATRNNSDLDFSSILDEVTMEKCKESKERKVQTSLQMKRDQDSNDVIDVDDLDDPEEVVTKVTSDKDVVKPDPKFVKIGNWKMSPESSSSNKCPKSSKSFVQTENAFMRSKKMKKIRRNLEKQKRKASNIDPNRKYFGFGESFNKDKLQLKQMRKDEKRREKEERKLDRIRTFKKAAVSKEEKDLMTELLQIGENSVSDSASNACEFKDEGVFMSEDIPAESSNYLSVSEFKFSQENFHESSSFVGHHENLQKSSQEKVQESFNFSGHQENLQETSSFVGYQENLHEFDLLHTASSSSGSDHIDNVKINMEMDELDALFHL